MVAAINSGTGNLGLPQPLVEVLASKFGYPHATGSSSELEAFLRDKAVEFAALQKRFVKIRDAEGAVSALVASAEAALQAGDFQQADRHLQEAEQLHLASVTLSAVRTQSELRAARAQAALLSGDVSVAVAHWATAALYFQPFEPKRGSGNEDTQHAMSCAVTATDIAVSPRWRRQKPLCSSTWKSGLKRPT